MSLERWFVAIGVAALCCGCFAYTVGPDGQITTYEYDPFSDEETDASASDADGEAADMAHDCFSLGPIVKSQRFRNTTGNPSVDVALTQECQLLAYGFGINPIVGIYDDSDAPNAFAVHSNVAPKVYIGARMLREHLWDHDKGGTAIAGIVAHEYAHLVQKRLGCELTGSERELHADFMAGWYLANKSRIAPVDFDGFARALYDLGDDEGFWDEASHGSPDERVDAMQAGFEHAQLPMLEAFAAGVEWCE